MDLMNTLASLFVDNQLAMTLIDLFVKSLIVLLVTLIAYRSFRKKLTAGTRHLLWLNSLFCLFLLPFLPGLTEGLAVPDALSTAGFTLIVLPATASNTLDNPALTWASALLAAYLVPCLYLLLRLGCSLTRLRRISRRAVVVDDQQLLHRLDSLRRQLGVSRGVALTYCDSVSSPVSCGLLSPSIILPEQARAWQASVLDDVIRHELAHIRRLDWPTMLFSYVVSCLYWPNPLCWLALSIARAEAETSCDRAVVHSDESRIRYAESLLSIARQCRAATPERLPVQRIVQEQTLATRINHILDETAIQNISIRKTAICLSLGSLALMMALGTTHIVSAQAGHAEIKPFYPLSHIVPYYPTRAAAEGIEGYVQVMFTISERGDVAQESLAVVDAEPAAVFEESALAAATQFKFSPRLENGEAVSVPGVQYRFRYRLSADSE